VLAAAFFVPKSLRQHEFNFVYFVLCSCTSQHLYIQVTCRLCYYCRVNSGTVEDTSKALCLPLLFLASLFDTLCQFLASPHTSSGLHLVAEANVNVSLNITRGIDVRKVFDGWRVTKVWLILTIVSRFVWYALTEHNDMVSNPASCLWRFQVLFSAMRQATWLVFSWSFSVIAGKFGDAALNSTTTTSTFFSNVFRLQLKCDGTRWRTGGEVKGKLANGVGSQYPSHYLRTRCIQHYYRWCAHLGYQ